MYAIGEEQDGIDRCIQDWIAANYQQSKSTQTRDKYSEYIYTFRLFLKRHGLDLDSSPTDVAQKAEEWAMTSRSRFRSTVAPSTYNHRLSIISSWYIYVIQHKTIINDQVLTSNPLCLIKRAKNVKQKGAKGIKTEQFIAAFKSINIDTEVGRRDSALIAVGACTGVRISELLGMTIGDITISGQCLNITIKRRKGGESDIVQVVPPFTHYVLLYLVDLYGENWNAAPPGTPLWVSMAINYYHEKLGYDAACAIIKRVFGSTKTHMLRKIAAQLLNDKGVPIQQIQRHLRHVEPRTTMRYFEADKPDTLAVFADLPLIGGE